MGFSVAIVYLMYVCNTFYLCYTIRIPTISWDVFICHVALYEIVFIHYLQVLHSASDTHYYRDCHHRSESCIL